MCVTVMQLGLFWGLPALESGPSQAIELAFGNLLSMLFLHRDLRCHVLLMPMGDLPSSEEEWVGEGREDMGGGTEGEEGGKDMIWM